MLTSDDSCLSRGYFETEELRRMNILPSDERIKKGRVAVMECVQEIPCDPCGFICKFNAIKKESISKPGKIDWDKCTGCGLCIGICPGLSIFTIQKKDGKGYISMPYELLPKPKKGELVWLLNRKGDKKGKGKVIQVLKQKKDPGVIVTVEVSIPDLVYDIRAIKVMR